MKATRGEGRTGIARTRSRKKKIQKTSEAERPAPKRFPGLSMVNHVLDLIFKPFNLDSGRDIDLVKGARGTSEVAGRGSTAWIGRHGGCCLLRYQLHLRMWGRRHGQNGYGEKRGRARLSRLICPEVLSGMVRESRKWKSAEVFRESVKARESKERK